MVSRSSHLIQLRYIYIFFHSRDLARHFTWKLATRPENYKQFASIFPNYDTDLPHNRAAASWILKVCPCLISLLPWRVNLWCPNFGIQADTCTLHPSAPAFVWRAPTPPPPPLHSSGPFHAPHISGLIKLEMGDIAGELCYSEKLWLITVRPASNVLF